MEAKDLGMLRGDCREELDDKFEPYLWDDDRLNALLNEAIAEANLRARLIIDRDSALCQIALQAGVAEYSLDPSVIVIRKASLASRPSDHLCRTAAKVLDDNCCDWRTTQGLPRFIVRDTRNTLILSPVPIADDTLQLEVWRNPTEAELMEEGDDPTIAGIDVIHHAKLVHWACFRALSKRDVEAGASSDAQMHYDLFESYFGARPTAAQLERLAIDAITGTQSYYF
jgi:hypothetical protein